MRTTLLNRGYIDIYTYMCVRVSTRKTMKEEKAKNSKIIILIIILTIFIIVIKFTKQQPHTHTPHTHTFEARTNTKHSVDNTQPNAQV